MDDTWTAWDRWRYAIKPASWPKLLVPMALGQALGVAIAGAVDPRALLVGLLFTLFDGIFIVLMNDWGDQEVDRIKREMFPDGCSPKTIPDGILPADQVLAGGIAAGGLAAATAILGGWWLGRPLLGAIGVASLLIFAAYTLPPLKLNYRGGGEFLEAIGVGFVLPFLMTYAQSGVVWDPRFELFAGTVALAMASALASGLSDEESDRAGGKTTFTTLLGNLRVRQLTTLCLRLGIVFWVLAGLRTEAPIWGCAVAGMVVLYHMMRMHQIEDAAVTNAFSALKLYKGHLHMAIWYGTIVLAAGLVAPF